MARMKKALAVIGAAYGDEGKGLMTDRLVSETGASVVVRTNGGAQAGHTVTTPDGKRHVFSHIGSGAFAGAATHLSRFFVVHPMFFLGERERVASLGGETQVSADPRAIVTTPYDILINQIMEDKRGLARHGSCGMGFGETIERNLSPSVALSVADLRGSRLGMVSKLERIRREWVPTRLRQVGVEDVPETFSNVLKDDGVLRRFLDDCEDFVSLTLLKDDADIEDGAVFEGAQGLLLDQDYGVFPHVTRSNTGLANMVQVSREAGIDTIAVRYATRAYTTRHGAGPLAHEGDDMGYASIVDHTNVHNDWQGTIRAAPLDLDILNSAIRYDLANSNGISIEPELAVSCLDQVAQGVSVYVDGKQEFVAAAELHQIISRVTDLEIGAVSRGPTRRDITKI